MYTLYISIYSINISVQILYNDVEKCITNKKKTRNDDDGKHGTEIFSPFVRLMYFDDEIIILIIINEKEKENFESIDFLHFSSTKKNKMMENINTKHTNFGKSPPIVSSSE